MILVCFEGHIDVLIVSMRFDVIFYIYEHFLSCLFGFVRQFETYYGGGDIFETKKVMKCNL